MMAKLRLIQQTDFQIVGFRYAECIKNRIFLQKKLKAKSVIG